MLASPTPSSPASDLQQLYFDEADHNIQALTTITLIEIARCDLQTIADKHLNALKAITIDNVIEASIEREWLLNVGRRIGRARLAHFLCEFAVRLAIKSHVPDQTAIALPLTQEQIGDAVALTPVHVNRMLKELEAEGLISKNVDPSDQRSQLVTITSQGTAMWETVRAVLDPERASVLANISSDDLANAERVLEVVFTELASRGQQ